MPKKKPFADISPIEVQEREKIQTAIGGVGGKPRLKGKILNAIFVVSVLSAFTMSLVTRGVSQIISIDVGLLLLSLKLAYHLHTEAKVNHAQFWILTTIEDRLLNVISELRALRKELTDSFLAKQDDSATGSAPERARNPQQED